MLLKAACLDTRLKSSSCAIGVFLQDATDLHHDSRIEPALMFARSVSVSSYIRKTCPCNVYPLEPHFYIAKLGFAGVYLFFLFLLQNIDCGYSLEPPRRGGSNMYPQSMF